jgi:hypothetical protein
MRSLQGISPALRVTLPCKAEAGTFLICAQRLAFSTTSDLQVHKCQNLIDIFTIHLWF